MEELHQTAEAYYQTAARDMKSLAEGFFNSLDHDKDREVSLPEFLAFMRREGYAQMANPHFFKDLNRNGTGKLDFMEVMTLYYIIQSGRQFCGGCGEFMKGLFFACVKCFEDKGTAFSLCPSCLKNDRYVHGHKQFLDSYVLLETKRLATLKEMEETNKVLESAKKEREAKRHIEEISTPGVSGTPAGSAGCTKMVVYNPNTKRNRLLEAAVRTVEGVARLVNCSIM